MQVRHPFLPPSCKFVPYPLKQPQQLNRAPASEACGMLTYGMRSKTPAVPKKQSNHQNDSCVELAVTTMLWYTRGAQSCNGHKIDVEAERRFCSIVMPGRAEGMERHVAVDCAAVDPQAKAEMSQHLYNKKMQTLERKGVKRRAGGEGAPSAEPSGPMLEPPPPMAPQIISHAHMPPYSGAACCTPMTVKSS